VAEYDELELDPGKTAVLLDELDPDASRPAPAPNGLAELGFALDDGGGGLEVRRC
jgi:hypothetical protein